MVFLTLGEINLIDKNNKFMEYFLKYSQEFLFCNIDDKLIDVNSSALKFSLQSQEFHLFRVNHVKKA